MCPNCGGYVNWLGTDASGCYDHGECMDCGATVYERRFWPDDEPTGYES